MKRVLLTGISGLVGHHVMEHIMVNTDWEIVGIASFKHRGDPHRLNGAIWERYHDRVQLVLADLQAPFSPRLAEAIGEVDVILNLAAESHVDRSIQDPVGFGLNNVSSTLHVLEFARWTRAEAFIQFSTDEVYGPALGNDLSREWDPIVPSNPYSASKAAQEAFAIAAWRTYGIPVVITNTMNVFGERQDPEKFIPKVMRAVLAGEEVTIHGRAGQSGSRFYIHARNVADALLFILRQPLNRYPDALRPGRYNIVGEREVTNLELATMIATHLGRELRYRIVDHHSSRPGHDMRYALDGALLASLGWTPPLDLEASLRKTIDWTLAHPEWLKREVETSAKDSRQERDGVLAGQRRLSGAGLAGG
jgi:dTDP-glucose 4,6-dehydratase